jgi:CheY-like chemotaxis protein
MRLFFSSMDPLARKAMIDMTSRTIPTGRMSGRLNPGHNSSARLFRKSHGEVLVLKVPINGPQETTEHPDQTYTVVCVDDNPQVAEAIRVKLQSEREFKWVGSAPDAESMLELVQSGSNCPDFVILDLDLPGVDPFEASETLANSCSETRIVVFTGHVHKELIDKAVEAGAWGYVAKSDGADALVSALRAVINHEFTLSPEARSVYDR